MSITEMITIYLSLRKVVGRGSIDTSQGFGAIQGHELQVLMQFCVLGLGRDEKRDVGIGIFP